MGQAQMGRAQMGLIDPDLVDPDEAGLGGGLTEPSANKGVEQAIAITRKAAREALVAIVGGMNDENIGASLGVIQQVALMQQNMLALLDPMSGMGSGLNQRAMKRLGMMGGYTMPFVQSVPMRRETMGVRAIREVVSSVRQLGDQYTASHDLKNLLGALNEAKAAGMTDLVAELEVKIREAMKRVSAPPVDTEAADRLTEAVTRLGSEAGMLPDEYEGLDLNAAPDEMVAGMVAVGGDIYDSEES